jgi:hypothetical protein
MTIAETNNRSFATATRYNARPINSGSMKTANSVSNDLDISKSNTPYTHAEPITSSKRKNTL